MDEAIKILQRIDNPALSRCEQARLRCEISKSLIEAGDYEGAREAMGDLWKGGGSRPKLSGLDRLACAEVLMCAGVLTGWIGSAHQTGGSQERAKDLISEARSLFESLGATAKAFEAQIEVAWCYWREGAFDEARVMLHDAQKRISVSDGVLRAQALVRAAIVERAAAKYKDALNLLTEATALVEESDNHALKGRFHNTFALLLNNLRAGENPEQYVDREIIEYTAASFHFEQAGHTRYQARVENNLGYLFFTIAKFDDALHFPSQEDASPLDFWISRSPCGPRSTASSTNGCFAAFATHPF